MYLHMDWPTSEPGSLWWEVKCQGEIWDKKPTFPEWGSVTGIKAAGHTEIQPPQCCVAVMTGLAVQVVSC